MKALTQQAEQESSPQTSEVGAPFVQSQSLVRNRSSRRVRATSPWRLAELSVDVINLETFLGSQSWLFFTSQSIEHTLLLHCRNSNAVPWAYMCRILYQKRR